MIFLILMISATFLSFLCLFLYEKDLLPIPINSDFLQISFQEFVSLYHIAPEKWKLEDDYVEYTKEYSEYRYRQQWETFEFKTLIDRHKYKKWKNKKEEQECNDKKLKKLKTFCECWQKDIEKYQKENQLNLQKAIDENKKIIERISKK